MITVIERPMPRLCTLGVGPDGEPLFVAVSDFVELTGTEVEWLWDGIIGRGMLTLLAAEPKVGKSTLVAHLLKAMVTGDPFLGRGTMKPTGVWIVAEEAMPLSLRLHELSLPSLAMENGVDVKVNQRYADWNDIQEAIEELPTGALLVLDTGSRFWDVEDENSASEVGSALWPLITLAQERRVAVVFVHHLGKGTFDAGRNAIPKLRRVRGSSALVGSVDVIVCVTKVGRPQQRRLTIEGRFGMGDLTGELTDAGYRLVGVEDLDVVDMPTARPSGTPPLGRRRQAMFFLKDTLASGPMRAQEVKSLAEKSGIPDPTLRRAKKALRVESVRRANHWEWRLPTAQGDQGDQGDQDAI